MYTIESLLCSSSLWYVNISWLSFSKRRGYYTQIHAAPSSDLSFWIKSIRQVTDSSHFPFWNFICLFDQNTQTPSHLLSRRVQQQYCVCFSNGSHQEMRLINNHLLHFVYPVCISLVTGVLPALFLSWPHWQERILINVISLSPPDLLV